MRCEDCEKKIENQSGPQVAYRKARSAGGCSFCPARPDTVMTVSSDHVQVRFCAKCAGSLIDQMSDPKRVLGLDSG